jgi:hypothetical protein
VRQPKRELAYSFTGTAGITPKDSEDVVFDFLSETAKATEALAGRRLPSLWHYADALREALWPLPDLARQALATFESPLQETTIFLDGYWDGRAKRAHIKFFFDGQQVPEVSADPLHPGAVLGAASMEVLKILMSDVDDGLLGAYRTPVFGIATLGDAIRATKAVIAAHCDPQALTVDPKCAAMGGHVHICKLTFADGFQWLPGFEPI